MNYADQQRSPTRHIVGLVAVVLFHILLIYALVNGLGHNIVEILKAPMATKMLTEKNKPPPPPPPPPPPDLAPPPPPYIPPPEIQVQQTTAPTNAITAVTHVAPPVVAPRPVAAPAPAVADRQFSARPLAGSGIPEFPSEYEEDGRTGRVTVDCVIEPDGHPLNCKVVSAQGGAAFASSAMSWLNSGRVRYSPAVRNGQPIAEDHQWTVTFKAAE